MNLQKPLKPCYMLGLSGFLQQSRYFGKRTILRGDRGDVRQLYGA